MAKHYNNMLGNVVSRHRCQVDVISGPEFRQGIVSIAHNNNFCRLSLCNAGKQIKSIIRNLLSNSTTSFSLSFSLSRV